MKTEIIQARVAPNIKYASAKILEAIGLSLSEAINIYLKRVIAEKAIPFELRIPNAETIKAMEDVRNRKNLVSYNSVEEFMAEFKNVKSNKHKKVQKRAGVNAKKGKKP